MKPFAPCIPSAGGTPAASRRPIPSRSRPLANHRRAMLLGTCLAIAMVVGLGACSPVEKVTRTTRRIVGDLPFTTDGMIRRVAILPLANRTFTAASGLEREFETAVTLLLAERCVGVEPVALPAGIGLDGLPRLPSGMLDTLALARWGRRLGLSAIAVGELADVRADRREKGVWWFRDTQDVVLVELSLALYSTETGAKVLDDHRLYQLEADPLDAASIQARDPSGVSGLTAKLTDLGEQWGDRVCARLHDAPWRAYVIDVDGTAAEISAGSRSGLAVGDLLTVLDTSQTIEGQGGQRFFLPGRAVGRLRLTRVEPLRAAGDLIEGERIPRDAALGTSD